MRIAILSAATLSLAACGSEAPSTNEAENAVPDVAAVAPREAPLATGEGKAVGTATLSEDPTGVTVKVSVTGLKAGAHGLHLHAVGSCTGPDFKSAGTHLNPANKLHGRDNPLGSHLGDLANLTVGADGKGEAQFLLGGAMMKQVVDGDGVSLVVHADADDYKTDPSGNSGDRIACATFN